MLNYPLKKCNIELNVSYVPEKSFAMRHFYRGSRCAVLSAALFLASAFTGSCSVPRTEKDFNVVLITIDTLRADHLSCYGYARNTSPTIDSIAEKGIVFKNAVAPSSWTAPSMVSLFTSVYPVNHGVTHGIGYRKNQTIHVQEVFTSDLITLAEILKAHGYKTFGVASNLHLSEKFGFARGFDCFKCLRFLPASPVNKTVYSWENEIKNSGKFFLWVHYIDPHLPYVARTPWIEDYTPQKLTRKLNLSKKGLGELSSLIPVFQKYPQQLDNLVALYDSEINFVDSYIGKLIERFGFDQETLLIITSDHGEEFLDHGKLGHGNNLHGETINIPLIVKLPDSSKKEIIHEQVELIDIMPTILHILNLDPPEQMLGKTLIKKQGLRAWVKELFSQDGGTGYKFAELDTKVTLKTIMTTKWKYIYDYKEKTEQLYNLTSDHLELNNLADKEIDKKNQLKKLLFEWTAHAKKYPTRKQPFTLSPTEKEKLKGLGYIQ